MRGILRNGLKRSQYFIVGVLIALGCAVTLGVGVTLDGNALTSISNLMIHSASFYWLRFAAYTILFIVWPKIIRIVLKEKLKKGWVFERKYLLVLIVLYEVVIVLNPLKVILVAFMG